MNWHVIAAFETKTVLIERLKTAKGGSLSQN